MPQGNASNNTLQTMVVILVVAGAVMGGYLLFSASDDRTIAERLDDATEELQDRAPAERVGDTIEDMGDDIQRSTEQ